ncbi:M14 family zinc carboxypeptidase [Halorarius halobius]|uniref:M14 family zinc carboxypeptidase n=1 Tax=Halorarius halobius TaxID=2962671 RepID=UPI0020CBBE48|nr:M14 family zinc carboxypeptidase [Halorarius halobius]
MNPFDDTPISRRDFARLSTAAGAALALPGNATADADSEAFDAEYRYVQNHTPADHSVPTLVTFTDAAGPASMDEAVAADVLTTTDPQPAAYGKLTTGQALAVADLPSADSFQFSPGSNPFWRIGYYPLGVFPEAERSVDFVGFEQLKDGLDELEARYPNRVRIEQMAGDGQSPGHLNNVTGRDDPKEMLVAEVTNYDSEATFEEKEKVFYSCSLHGLERAGAEAGARIIENIARDDQFARGPDESKQSVTELLDDAVLIFGFTNPDGWAVRNPQYDSGWQTNGPGATSVGGQTAPRVPAAPLYERGNAEIYDTNRQYPAVGCILPTHYPADPETVENNERGRITEDNVPDALAVVEHFREYENLNYGADLHGGPVFNEFVLGLISQDQYNTREMHETYEMCRVIDDVLEEELTVWEEAGNLKQEVLGDQTLGVLFGVLPEEAFDYAGIFDTIGYNVSGAMLDWMSHPEELGGLGMTTLDFEMAFSHMTGGNVYNPALLDMEVRGYRTAIRTIARFAVQNSDTPTTDDEFSATTKTFSTESDPERVAYVTTGEVGTADDALRRHSGTLDFDGDGVPEGPDPDEVFGQSVTSETLSAGETLTATHTVEESGLHSLYAHPHTQQAFLDLELVAPDGSVAADFEAVGDERAGGMCCGHPEFVVSEPEAGEWTLRMTNVAEEATAVDTQFATLAATGTNPDPVPAVGYAQRAYDVSPFRFFEDYADSIPADDPGVVEPVTVDDVAAGALGDYDHAVVIHDYGANGDAGYVGASDGPVGYRPASSPAPGETVDGYVDALDEFVDEGNNLVLTDMGVNLLSELDNTVVSGVADDDVSTTEYVLGKVGSKNLDHRLMTDVRPIQGQLLKAPPLGYTPGSEGAAAGEFPMRLVTESAFTDAGADGEASVAATTGGGVSAGSITTDGATGVHVISSLLPPATQKNLHPFGLVDYAPSFLGYLLLTSALGFQQVRTTAEDADGTRYGAGPASGGGGGDTPLSASGSRTDDGSVHRAGMLNEVEVTLDSFDGASEVTVTDSFPPSWEMVESPDGATVDGEAGTIEFASTTEATTFSYILRAPDSPNSYTFGPAVAEADGTTVEFGGTTTEFVVPNPSP